MFSYNHLMKAKLVSGPQTLQSKSESRELIPPPFKYGTKLNKNYWNDKEKRKSPKSTSLLQRKNGR